MSMNETGAARADRPCTPRDIRRLTTDKRHDLVEARRAWTDWTRHDASLPPLVRLIAAEIATRVSFFKGSRTVAAASDIGSALGVSPIVVERAVQILERDGWLLRDDDDTALFAMSVDITALKRIDPDGKTWRDARAGRDGDRGIDA